LLLGLLRRETGVEGGVVSGEEAPPGAPQSKEVA
jgi:hypothetical protein